MMRIERSEIRVISVGGMEVCLRGVGEVLGGVSGCRGGVREVCREGVGEVLGRCVRGCRGCRGSVLGMG